MKYLREVTPYFRKASIIQEVGWELQRGFLSATPPPPKSPPRADTRYLPLQLCRLTRAHPTSDPGESLWDLNAGPKSWCAAFERLRSPWQQRLTLARVVSCGRGTYYRVYSCYIVNTKGDYRTRMFRISSYIVERLAIEIHDSSKEAHVKDCRAINRDLTRTRTFS